MRVEGRLVQWDNINGVGAVSVRKQRKSYKVTRADIVNVCEPQQGCPVTFELCLETFSRCFYATNVKCYDVLPKDDTVLIIKYRLLIMGMIFVAVLFTYAAVSIILN
ncbi:hypothetical protein [Photobacterium damselae]|uniref:Uncharacterized protein n=1 Tax=Photobacterium damselae subsp. damselae TaxID=85581 RepID=A0A7Y7QAL4_PHODD|nr:hypothetical protein [Photobacterium damselae]AWK84600.1 hypothetical protein BST98_21475 [Photobacterium damselae]KAB1185704.1 hypothetical protein F6450_01015 [Photobacterium damselae subsp. damselae]MCG3826530.1 hypothetical protein [Photobacterium damselae]NVO61479.1 hypothetical protein [Photobacterium damselae subsp. damselae]NVP02112.1 hypothetical protein [Photobacterium damselae subsp. damselae]